ncbi:MAG TPA: M20 aminoacylase family protein [Stellaceae bacterium]|nr:M20 aminoacylase family protein [Stellaceae bacterium]
MPVINRIAEFHPEMTAWRQRIHAHPETAFEEHETAALVAELLESFGIAVERGVARTGVIGTLKGSVPGSRAIALRADMDALPILEQNAFSHASQAPGRMHACGHDGHTAMLLGAAKHLAETRNFAGTIHFVFQPAEENEGGARVMIEEGVLDRHPVEAVYGMHNWPGLPVGQFAVRPGPMMAAFDIFEIRVTGRGAHAAMPHLGVDPVVAAAQVVGALQTIASRNVHPLESAVVSVTQIHGGDTWNVIPETVVLRGTTRSFSPAVRDALEPAIRRIAEGVCNACGAQTAMHYERRYPPTINTAPETEIAAAAAASLVGDGNVQRDLLPSMGAEDFAWFLQNRPGAYIWIGNGAAEGGAMLHNPHYDFNDAILPLGASYWVRLAETVLAK